MESEITPPPILMDDFNIIIKGYAFESDEDIHDVSYWFKKDSYQPIEDEE